MKQESEINYDEEIKKYTETSKKMVSDAFWQINRFQEGLDNPIRTSYEYLNENMLGGFFPSDVVCIAGISGSGKTYFLSKLEEDIFDKELNPDCDEYIYVKCNWEMSVFKLLLRKLSNRLDKSMADILKYKIDDRDKPRYKRTFEEEANERIYYNERALTPDEFYDMATAFCEKFKKKKRIVFGIDHAAMTRGSDKKYNIDQLFEYVNLLKKKYTNTNWIILSQLNRDIEKRVKPSEHAPIRGDLYHTDTIYQLSDIVLCVHIPQRVHLNSYMYFRENEYAWLDKYKTENKRSFEVVGTIMHHFLKVRELDVKANKDIRHLFIEVFPKFKKMYDDKERHAKETAPNIHYQETEKDEDIYEGSNDMPF